MSCQTCSFSPEYRRGETLKFTVDILIYNETTKVYEGVETLVGWDAGYILKQGNTVIQFALADAEISILGDYTFVISVDSSELSQLKPGKVEHEFWTVDTSDALNIIFSDCFTIEKSLLWETL